MPRAGGQSTAEGVSYQAMALAYAIIDVWQGRVDHVRAEVPPQADLGQRDLMDVQVDDYVVQWSGRRVYCQAKSNAPGNGSWTLGKLLREEILQKFLRQIQADPDAECWLVTPCSCPLLDEIAQQARGAASAKEFVANLGKKQGKDFRDMCRHLRISHEAGHNLLRHCRLEVRAMGQMASDLRRLAEGLFADPPAAVQCLHSLAIESMRKGQSLDQRTVQEQFAESSVFARPKATDEQLLQGLKLASARLATVSRHIAGVHVHQLAVDQIFDWVKQGDRKEGSVAVLLDQAGSGKSVAMAELQHRLREADYAVLGLKIDGLTFSSPQDLASAAEIPATIPSAVQRLAASGRRVVVLIDQVDALSSAMSRRPEAINVVLQLVAQLAGLRQVPVVVACRSFDWRYDSRIRSLMEHRPREFALAEFSDAEIQAVLAVAGLQQTDLHPLTLQVIRRPLHLKVLMAIVEERRRQDPRWSPAGRAIYTLQSLYQEFWDLKMSKAMETGAPGTEACETLSTRLAQRMQESQELAVPEAEAADQRPVVAWMVSEGILSRQGKVLSFFHQTFFDFVVARHFVRQGYSLVEYLAGTDQGLFFRPMTRQVLEYLRDASRKRYLAELRSMLGDARIRRHLHWLVVTWLGQLPDPGPQELAILEPLLASVSTRWRVLNGMWKNPAWFDLITPGRIAQWLTDEHWAPIGYIRTIFADRQAAVTDLLAPFVGRGEVWNERILSCLTQLNAQWEDRPAGLLLDVLRNPLTDLDGEPPRWAYALERLAGCQPERACQILAVILERYKPRWRPEEHSPSSMEWEEGLLPPARHLGDVLAILSQKVPEALLEAVLPCMFACLNITCGPQNNLRFRRNDWLWRDVGPGTHRTAEVLMVAVWAACTRLRQQVPGTFRGLTARLLADPFLPMQEIVAEEYAASPAEFAADAASFLCGDARRLWLGFAGTVTGLTTRLIRACLPHWTEPDVRRIEQAILSIDVPPSKQEFKDWIQLELLEVLGPERLSPRACQHLAYLKQEHPDFLPEVPQEVEMQEAQPPIPAADRDQLNDDGWLEALRRPLAERCEFDAEGHLQGGQAELTGILADQAKKQPERFYRLAMAGMDAGYHRDYAEAIIAGVAEAGLGIEKLDGLVGKFAAVLSNGSIRQVAHAVGRYAGQHVTPELVRQLQEWTLHAGDPPPSRSLQITTTEGRQDRMVAVNAGINTDRGCALYALATVLLKATPPRRKEYLDLAEQVTADVSPAVRAVCIQFLRYAFPEDPVWTCSLFRRLVGGDPMLLREASAYSFVCQALPGHAGQTFWAIEAMLADEACNDAREAGAKLACLAAFWDPAAEALRNACLAGDVVLRKGAAGVYATNVVDRRVGTECRQRLQGLWNDRDGQVRAAATHFLRRLGPADLRELDPFLREWAGTPASEEGVEAAAQLLEKHPTVNPRLTLDIAERIVQIMVSHVGDATDRYGHLSYHLTPAILSIYHQTSGADLRSRSMNLFERLEELGCSDVTKAMEDSDRI